MASMQMTPVPTRQQPALQALPRRVVRRCTRSIRAQAASNGAQTKTTIHRLVEEHGTIMLPGVWDALSVKVAQRQGHVGAFVSGYAVSATLIGEPDVGLLTPPEMSRKLGQICLSVPEFPVLVDADTGGGNVLNVARTIRQFVAAGAKGCVIEDQKWPKKSGSMQGKEVIGMEEHAAKIFAAREAIGDADFFLVARTDARATSAKHGLEDAITRANLYVDAGADASFVEGPRNDIEFREVGKRTRGIKVCSMLEGGLTPLRGKQQCKEMGFEIVLRPVSGLYAATRALLDAYGHLRDDDSAVDLSRLVNFNEFNELIGMEEKLRLEQKYGRGEGMEKLHVRIKAPSKPYSG